jgi:hypothetical protein
MYRAIVLPGVAVALVCAGSAQEAASEPVMVVATGIGESARVAPTVPAAERRPVLAKAWQVLGRLVERRVDGISRTLHRCEGVETWVEWRNLTVAAINDAELDRTDRHNNVSRRYRCLVTADAHRVWQSDRIAWSDWQPGGYQPFPQIIEISCVQGEWLGRTVHAGEFIPPGGGGSSSAGNGIEGAGSHARKVAMQR